MTPEAAQPQTQNIPINNTLQDNDMQAMVQLLQQVSNHFKICQSKKKNEINEKDSYIWRLSDAYKKLQQENVSLKNECNKIEQEKINLLQENNKLRQENFTLKQKNNAPPIINNVGDNNIIVEFNAWASNPVNHLPVSFKYIIGDIKVRNEQALTESSVETKWITNRNGSKTYLFPNPLFFYEATDIRELYKITGALKAKGQNKIQIIKACEILDKGYINYPGELQLI
ncbi:MAG: hypothetical protein LBT01_03375 [Spirochaetaceae bacterium]|jgi:hypothetical protein|nr:hypothetical protein [Spirochaetaceae bacterium]